MVKNTQDGKPKRPDADDPFATAARLERQKRLAIPLRKYIEAEGVYDDSGPTKADIRDRQEDSTREKNASIRDKENENYAVGRERVLADWLKRDGRKQKRDVINQRKMREAEKLAFLNNDDPTKSMRDLVIADDATISKVAQVDKRRGAAKVQSTLKRSLERQLEEDDLEDILPQHVLRLINEPRKRGGRG